MKRISSVVVSAGAAFALLLAGCGADEEADEANGLRKGVAATTEPAAASDTTCAQFKDLAEDAQKALVERVLAEHPESTFAGSPNVALGTAKLVCNAGSLADTPVARAAGLVPKN